MPKIYLVNVGANTKHSQSARSPIFHNGAFVYVPFPDNTGRPYNEQCLPFVQGPATAHDDPDWQNLTYGDTLRVNGRVVPRSIALARVEEGDILLFWALLWNNNGNGWAGFDENRGWYLIGALRISEISFEGHAIHQVTLENRQRAASNIHFYGGQIPAGHFVFIGDINHSARFSAAVDLEATNPNGFLFQAFRSANGQNLHQNQSPRWRSSLRSCRALFDLQDIEQRQRAELVRQRIQHHNQFDLLADLQDN